VLAAGGAPAGASGAGDLRLAPRPGWSSGRHHVDLGLEHRYRLESWSAFTSRVDNFHAFRTRVHATYRYGDRLRLVAQGQHTALVGLGADASGVGAVYRANTEGGTNSTADDFSLSQLFAEVKPLDGLWLRGGRELVRGGTYLSYPEPAWRFLKGRRLSQRLLGTVGWTHGERAFDGGHGQLRIAGHALHAFGLRPTTGVFDIEGGYRPNRDIWIGGLDYTLERGTWREDTELGAFFLGYSDERDPSDVAGLFGEIEVYTFGARWLGVYPLGAGDALGAGNAAAGSAGRIDVLLWGAVQLGDFVDEGPSGRVRQRDQRAGAAIAEVGYAHDGLPGQPHLRVGVNYASGDGDPDDETRSTFFNLLPTNHGYYGYLDQFAFQNLVDLLVQLRLRPLRRGALAKLALELDYHRFWLAEDEDFRWAGSGAFARDSLGFVRNPSRGSRDAGHELDVTGTLPVHTTTVVKVGYSRLWGGDVFDDDDADWFYTQVELRY